MTGFLDGVLDRLLGLGEFGFAGEGVRFAFLRPLPDWGWLLALVAIAAVCVWSYRRLTGPRWARTLLASCRGLLLVLLLVLTLGPTLVQQSRRVERDWVVVLIDRSTSMTVPDVRDAGSPGGWITRDEQLKRTLLEAGESFDALDESREVLYLSFGASAREIARPDPDDLPAATSPRTSLASAVEEALRRTAGRRLSGVIVLSDGASLDEPDAAGLARLRAEQVKVVAVPLGSGRQVGDLAVRDIVAPEEAFLGDTVPVRIRLDRFGEGDAPSAAVRVIDDATGAVLGEEWIDDIPEGGREVVARVSPRREGSAIWRVEVQPAQADLIALNNTGEARLSIVDRPVRVAHFDGYPRWEYRYLTTLLRREPTIESSSLLLAADRRFTAEGDVPLTRPPVSPEEWAAMNVVLLGDLRPELFGERSLANLEREVAERGTGLLLIAGPGAMPHRWRASALADLLPMRVPDDTATRVYDTPVTMLPGPAAAEIGLLGIARDEEWPAAIADPASGWSQLRGAVRIEPEDLKPGAEVIAYARPIDGGEPTPLIVTMRYGAGRVVFVGTDEIWRWRYGRGERLAQESWIPIVRALAGSSLGRTARPATLELMPSRGIVDAPVSITLRLIDPRLNQSPPETIALRISGGEGGRTRVDLPAARRTERGAAVSTYSASWTPREPGIYTIEAVSPTQVGGALVRLLEVVVPDDERLRPAADHELLRRLASSVEPEDGIVLEPGQLAGVERRIPRDERVILGTPRVRVLWDRPAVLLLLLGLLTLEWVGRKLLSLS